MKLYLTSEQIDEVIEELDDCQLTIAFEMYEDDGWDFVYLNDRIVMLKEVLSNGYIEI